MYKIFRHRVILFSLGLMVSGCVTDTGSEATSSVTTGASAYTKGDLSSLTYRAVDLILATAPEVTARTPIVVSSIANTEHVETSSPFGNIIADMIRTRLVQDGHLASEIRLRNEVSFRRGEGEFLLSRNRRALLPPPVVSAIVTGTYAASYEKVYVSIKLVSAIDAHIIAGADFVVPLDGIAGMMPDNNTKS